MVRSIMTIQSQAPENTDENTTHFGYETVSAPDKVNRVREVFDAVAPKYDLMNDLMSGGVHRLWKDSFADQLSPGPNWSVIDVAGGTGDIAFRLLDRMRKVESRLPHTGSVTVCDINESMLSHGRDRALDSGKLNGLEWVVGNAESLPVPDMHFDAYTIAFGLRNVTNIEAALREARRVLKPGGRFMCLEFSQVVVPGLDKIYDAYSFGVLPRLGQMVAQDGAAYRYLAESIRRFPKQDDLAAMMTDADFKRVSHRNLAGGVAAIHSGWRI